MLTILLKNSYQCCADTVQSEYTIQVLAEKAIDAVNQKLWSTEDGTYMDIVQGVDSSSSGDYDKIYRLLTQDVTYFLIAITANTVNDGFKDIVQQQVKKNCKNKGKKNMNQ
jgi:hypothetical protein